MLARPAACPCDLYGISVKGRLLPRLCGDAGSAAPGVAPGTPNTVRLDPHQRSRRRPALIAGITGRSLGRQNAEVTDVPTIELPMVCTCGDDGRAAARELMADVIERLSRGSEELAARSVTSENFLTEVVYSLNWDYGAHIMSIDNDQWSAVTVEKYDGTLRLRVECDFVEHGG